MCPGNAITLPRHSRGRPLASPPDSGCPASPAEAARGRGGSPAQRPSPPQPPPCQQRSWCWLTDNQKLTFKVKMFTWQISWLSSWQFSRVTRFHTPSPPGGSWWPRSEAAEAETRTSTRSLTTEGWRELDYRLSDRISSLICSMTWPSVLLCHPQTACQSL